MSHSLNRLSYPFVHDEMQIIVLFPRITHEFGDKPIFFSAELGLINELKLTVALIWEMQDYTDANDHFHKIYSECRFCHIISVQLLRWLTFCDPTKVRSMDFGRVLLQ